MQGWLLPPYNIWDNLSFSPSAFLWALRNVWMRLVSKTYYGFCWLLINHYWLVRPPQVRAPSLPTGQVGFSQSLPHLPDRHFPLRVFGRYNDVLAYPSCQASYAIPVRQYRGLPVGFLHCMGHPKPACHLLMLQGVTPAHKGLAPSGIISCRANASKLTAKSW